MPRDTQISKLEDLVYPDECYKIIGAAMDAHNKLGYGYEEKTYQKAMAIALSKIGLQFVEQLYAPVMFEGEIVDRNFFDFLVNGLIVVELKRGDHFATAHIEQVFNYLIAFDHFSLYAHD